MDEVVEVEAGAIAAVSKLAPDEARSKRIAESFLALAEGFEIKTQQDYDQAAIELRAIITRHSNMDAERKSFTDPLRDVLDRLNAKYQPWLKVLRGDGKKETVHAEGIIKAKMSAFLTEQARLAEVARKEAEAIAAAERQRLADEAEALRKKAQAEADEAARVERERVAEAERQQKLVDDAAALVKNKAARAKAEEAAELLRRMNQQAAEEAQRQSDAAQADAERQAQALETTAAVTIVQPAVVAVQKGRGISTPKTVDFELASMLELVKHIGTARPDLIVLLDLNETKMRALVKMMGMGTDLPGVRVFEKTGITVR